MRKIIVCIWSYSMKKVLLVVTLGLVWVMNVQAAPDIGKRTDHSRFCQGKALNSKVNIKNNGRDIQGTCQLGFKANEANKLERGVMRNPSIQQACIGKAKGVSIIVKVNGKAIAGKCDVIFKPNMRG